MQVILPKDACSCSSEINESTQGCDSRLHDLPRPGMSGRGLGSITLDMEAMSLSSKVGYAIAIAIV